MPFLGRERSYSWESALPLCLYANAQHEDVHVYIGNPDDVVREVDGVRYIKFVHEKTKDWFWARADTISRKDSKFKMEVRRDLPLPFCVAEMRRVKGKSPSDVILLRCTSPLTHGVKHR